MGNSPIIALIQLNGKPLLLLCLFSFKGPINGYYLEMGLSMAINGKLKSNWFRAIIELIELAALYGKPLLLLLLLRIMGNLSYYCAYSA